MVKHIVLFKLKSQSEREKAIEALMGMKGKIEGMLDIEAGADFANSYRSYDIALICTFKDKEALEIYQLHPVHAPVKDLMAQIRESSVSCDYEY